MAEQLPMVIDQGEDWTAELIWTDNFDEPMPVTHPCRLDIRSKAGQTVASLETNPELEDGYVPSIAYSTETGIIQLHLPAEQTAYMPAGVYHYDLFVTVEDSGPAGNQIARILYGPVTVNKRVTLV